MLNVKSFFQKILKYKNTFIQFILLLLILGLIYKGHLLNLKTHILFGLIDVPLNMYFLEWASKYVLNDVSSYINSIYSLPISYPYQNSLAFSDNLFGNLFIFLPLYFFSDNSIYSYNLWILISHGLNFFAMIFFLKRTKLIEYKSDYYLLVLTTLGGVIFAFSLPAITLLGGHYQLLPMFFIPICIYFYERIWFENSIKSHILFALSFSIQFYLGIQLGFLLVILLIAMTPVYYINAQVRVKEILKNSFYNITIITLFVGILLYPYLLSAQLTGYRNFTFDILPNIPSITDFFTTEMSYNFNNWISLYGGKHHEKAIFLGYGILFLLIVFFINKLTFNKKLFTFHFYENTKQINYLFLGLIFVSLFLIYESHIFQLFFKFIPGFNSIRTPGRFVLIVAFIFAILITIRLSKINISKLNIIVIIFYSLFFIEMYSISIKEYNYKAILSSKVQIKDYQKYFSGPSIVLPLYPMPVYDYMSSLLVRMINYSFYTPILNIYSGYFPTFNDEISKQYTQIKNDEEFNLFIDRIYKLGFHNIIVDKTEHLNENLNLPMILKNSNNVTLSFEDNKISIWSLNKKLPIYYPSLNNSLKDKKDYFEPKRIIKLKNNKLGINGKIKNDNSIIGVVQKKEKIEYSLLMSNDNKYYEKVDCKFMLDSIVDSYSDFNCILNDDYNKNELYFKNMGENKVYKVGLQTPNTKPLKDFKMNIEVLSVDKIENDSFNIKIKLTNLGDEIWNAGYVGANGLAVSYSIENEQQKIKIGYDSRIYLPYDINSKESVEMDIPIKHLEKGINKINFSMVQELVAWFHERESNVKKMEIEVNEY